MLTHIISSVILHNAFRRDIDYFCVVHESGRGLFAHAKGRPTGSKITPLPCSMSMMDKTNELRKDFGLNNKTKMVVMLSISTHCWVRRRYCLAGITKLGERVAKNTKLG